MGTYFLVAVILVSGGTHDLDALCMGIAMFAIAIVFGSIVKSRIEKTEAIACTPVRIAAFATSETGRGARAAK